MREKISIQKELSRRASQKDRSNPRDMAAPNAERRGVKKSITPLPKRFSHSALGSR